MNGYTFDTFLLKCKLLKKPDNFFLDFTLCNILKKTIQYLDQMTSSVHIKSAPDNKTKFAKDLTKARQELHRSELSRTRESFLICLL